MPFGILSAYLFARPLKIALVTVVLDGFVWVASVKTAVFLIADRGWNAYLGMAVAGVVGGLGAGASVGLSRRALLSLSSLGSVAIVGCVSALPFGYWEPMNSDALGANLLGALCFVVWQAAVGMRLSTLCATTSQRLLYPVSGD